MRVSVSWRKLLFVAAIVGLTILVMKKFEVNTPGKESEQTVSFKAWTGSNPFACSLTRTRRIRMLWKSYERIFAVSSSPSIKDNFANVDSEIVQSTAEKKEINSASGKFAMTEFKPMP